MSERVLMIDDDAALAGMLAEYLGSRGLPVTTAGTLAQGEALLKQGGFDALILDHMLAAASHELRSPLARIRMASGLICELDTLIGDLLLASRLSSNTPQLRPEEVDVLGLAAEEAARAGAELSGDPLTLQADARLLLHLLRNLLEYSRRHAAGTRIDLEVVATEGGGLLRELDRGPGVPEAERARVFEPFYRPAGTSESGEGAGYGLAFLQRIARLHGGGACFEVSLRSTTE